MRISVFLIPACLMFLLTFPEMSSAFDFTGTPAAPGEYPEVRGIPCGSWMAKFTLTEKCEELEEFFNKWEPLAEQGNPIAQTLIGLKYFQYPQTTEKTAEWMHKAADQDYGPAQFELAMLYENGTGGAAQDNVQAYMWYSLALKNGEIKAESKLKEMEKDMSPKALAKAQKLAKEWPPTPYEKSSP
jgi:Sel1 repeat